MKKVRAFRDSEGSSSIVSASLLSAIEHPLRIISRANKASRAGSFSFYVSGRASASRTRLSLIESDHRFAASHEAVIRYPRVTVASAKRRRGRWLLCVSLAVPLPYESRLIVKATEASCEPQKPRVKGITAKTTTPGGGWRRGGRVDREG